MSSILKPHHDHASLIFPKGFLWGAATSAYQVEGDNTNSDWWAWEQKHQPKEKHSGKTANQYNKFPEDFKLAKSLKHNAHRLSIEWSRIEPREGDFDINQIEHYRRVLQDLKDKNVKVMLTLWHFTLPLWVADKGGWTNSKTAWYFNRFVKKIAEEFKDLVNLWITINEPGIYAWACYSKAMWPPAKKSRVLQLKAFFNLCRAHKLSYKTIHQIIPHTKVGIANNVFSIDVSESHSIFQHFLDWFYDLAVNHAFYIFTGINTHDFLGLNYYLHYRLGHPKKSYFPKFLDASWSKKDVSDMGWELFPEGIFDVLVDLASYKKPIYITENGLASTNDDRRVRFLISYLKEVYHAINSGVDIRGYFHWSLIDNFEWSDGFSPRFGLIEVDFKTQKRTIRPSAYIYADIIKNNGISHNLLKFQGHGIKVADVLTSLKPKA